MRDLMRMFQPKNSPFSNESPDPEGRLFQPRRSPEPPTPSPSSGPPMLRDEIETIPPAQREIVTLGYGERAAMQKEDRVTYRGGPQAGTGGGGDGNNRRRPLTLSEIFSRSKAEGEEKVEPTVKVQYKRNVSQGRGRSAAR